MQRLMYLLVGLLVAILLGVAYSKFSSPLGEFVPLPPAPADTPVGTVSARPVLIALASWVVSFLPLPKWLMALLGMGILFIGFVLSAVSGLFTFMTHANNGPRDGDFVDLLCGLSMVAAGLWAVAKAARDRE